MKTKGTSARVNSLPSLPLFPVALSFPLQIDSSRQTEKHSTNRTKNLNSERVLL